MCRCRACITRRQQRTSSFKIRGRACWVTAIKHAHRRRSVLLAWMLLNDGGQQPVQTGAKAYSLRFQILIARWQPFGSCILSVQLTLRWQQVLRKLNQICKGLLSLLFSHSALVRCMPHSMSKRQLAGGGFSLLFHLLFDVCGDIEDAACWHIADRTPATILLVPVVLQCAVFTEVVPTPGHLHSETFHQASWTKCADFAAAGALGTYYAWTQPAHACLTPGWL